MRIYGKVKIAFWEDEKISSIGDSAKLLALYCLTGEHSNAIGCYRLPYGYIQTDLKWSEEKAKESLKALIAIDFVAYDEETQFLFIVNFLEHNPIENSRVGKMCVALVNSAMRSKIFPRLVSALQPHKHRFILNDNNFWQLKWDTVPDTLSQNNLQTQYTPSDTVSNTPFNTVSGKILVKNDDAAKSPDNTGEYTVSDSVCDTASSTLNDLVAPEPKPEPEPEPEIRRDDDSAREKNLPVEIIKAFDESIIEVFGKEQARPWPNGNDMEMAREFVKVGADLELCQQLFLKHQSSHKRKGQFPIGSLAYFRSAVPDALNERNFYQKNPVTEVSNAKPTARTGLYSGAKSAHDAFTEAAVTVLNNRSKR